MTRYAKKQLILVLICVLVAGASVWYILQSGSLGFSSQSAQAEDAASPTDADAPTTNATASEASEMITISVGQSVPVRSLNMIVTLQRLEVMPCQNVNQQPTNDTTCVSRPAQAALLVQPSVNTVTPEPVNIPPLPPDQIFFTSLPGTMQSRGYLYQLVDAHEHQARVLIESLSQEQDDL